MKDRINKIMVDSGLVGSKERARALIMEGNVLVNGSPVTKVGAIALVGVILSVGGYVAGAVQSPRSVLTIRLLVGGFSGFIFLGGIVSMLFYPITRERYQDIQRQLAERKAAVRPGTGV